MIQKQSDMITKWEHSGKLIIVRVRKSTTDIFRQALLLQREVVGYFGDLITFDKDFNNIREYFKDSFEIWVH